MILDQSTYFPYVNLAQLAADAGDLRRTEYWIAELTTARKGMEEHMKNGLAKYLDQAEWSSTVEPKRFWQRGPARWIAEALKTGVLPLLLLAFLIGASAAPAAADPVAPGGIETVSHGGGKARSGAGGN